MKKILLMMLCVGACVDVPGVPVDGQVYACSLADGDVRLEVERCGSWDGWEELGYALADEHPGFDVDCRGTREACSYEAP